MAHHLDLIKWMRQDFSNFIDNLSLKTNKISIEELKDLLSLSDKDIANKFKTLRGKYESDSNNRFKSKTNSFFDKDAFLSKLVRMQAAKELQKSMGIPDYIDDPQIINLIDPGGMTNRINRWPEFMKNSLVYMEEHTNLIKEKITLKNKINRIIYPGAMGGSSIGHKLVIQILKKMGFVNIPIEIIKDYPGEFNPLRETDLVVIYSFSGNTEETINWIPYAIESKAQILIISSGGMLKDIAQGKNYPFIKIPIEYTNIRQPREHLPISIVIDLVLLSILGLVSDCQGKAFSALGINFTSTYKYLHTLIKNEYGPGIPFSSNLAKKAALFIIYGTIDPYEVKDFLEKPRIILCGVNSNSESITRLKNQLNECSEKLVDICIFPENFHNMIESITTEYSEDMWLKTNSRNLFFRIRGNPYTDRAELRFDETIRNLIPDIRIFTYQIPQDPILPVIDVEMGNLLFLDFTRAYASILRGVDPLRVDAMDYMKGFMANSYPLDLTF